MKRNIFFSCILLFICALLLIGCDSPSGGGGGGGSGKSRSQKYTQKDSYGQSTLPDLNNASSLAGQCYVSDDNDGAIFFNEDGTCYIWVREGSNYYGIQQLINFCTASYTYNTSSKKLKMNPIALLGDIDSEKYVDYVKKLTAQQMAMKGISNISIPQSFINGQKDVFATMLARTRVEYECSISSDTLILSETSVPTTYKYTASDTDTYIYFSVDMKSIRMEIGSAELIIPIITSLENGHFSGSDYNWVGTTGAMLQKRGDFTGTYSISGDTCTLTITSATGTIPTSLMNTYTLTRDTYLGTEYLKPVLKTINYTVIGSDGEVAYDKAQAFITDSSMTTWANDTFEDLDLISTSKISGIYKNQSCTQSATGSQITDGGRVYVKLNNMTAVQYRSKVGGITFDGAPEATVTITND